MVFFRDQLTADFWLTQSDFEQTRDPFCSASSCRRHAVKRMRHASQSVLQSSAHFFLPSIGMAAADNDSRPGKVFHRGHSSFYFRRNGDALDHVAMFEQAANQIRVRFANELEVLRPGAISRDKRSFHMCARNFRNLSPKFPD